MTDRIDDCWNRLGVHGDQSCARLPEHVHCRNCEVYTEAAAIIMHRPLPESYRDEWTQHFAQPPRARRDLTLAALVFRLGAEWLCLPAHLSVTIAEIQAPHRLPHRGGKVLKGIVNVKGRLYPCMSLAGLLDVGSSDHPPPRRGRRAYPRLLVLQLQDQAFALPVDDLHGIHRHGPDDVHGLPASTDSALGRYATGILQVEDMRVGYLDAGLIGHQFAQALK